MKRIAEVVVVEGKYDKNALAQVVDASIITLEGFAAFHDKEKLSYLRRLAEKQGLVILTDSDGAGFVLRNFLKGALPSGQVKHAYIPEIQGKERRKRKAGKEGKLGVEGMRPEILLEALRRAGATFLDATPDSGAISERPDGGATGERADRSATPDGGATDKRPDGGGTSERPEKSATPDGNTPSANPDGGTIAARPESDAITMADFMEWGLSGAADSAERRRELLKRLSLPQKLNARALLDALNLLYGRERFLAVWETDAQSVGD